MEKFRINKGINTPLEFKGLKAQYIWYLAIATLALLFLFALLYYLGIPSWISLGLIGSSGGTMIWVTYRLSDRFGQYGLQKWAARRRCPKVIRIRSRAIFNDPSIKEHKNFPG
ncbi:DUF4133 domain-containing protein [Sphingobacterium sp. CZ-2]|uniref:DUF4133 domain-containing protein n=1 Tax=Sphingobacterium sp. CZ-2 TaxID=2557994 RepID=UPI00106F5688|nr:DUF4133 domain-containing protein [Sphingobacterium sp. CZ-2]QBR13535.1 DUF4133 domain-containing protein [Sphingobacterium sp. CZ-2]